MMNACWVPDHIGMLIFLAFALTLGIGSEFVHGRGDDVCKRIDALDGLFICMHGISRAAVGLAAAAVVIAAICGVARADELDDSLVGEHYGCTVVLCSANPDGPKAADRCPKPIDKLHRDLARGRGYPSCNEGGDEHSGTGTFLRAVTDYYDPCPAGTGAIAPGLFVVSGAPGDTPRRSELSSDEQRPGDRACVAGPIGSVNYAIDYSGQTVAAYVFSRVEWQKPQLPNATDIYIDGKFYRRVRADN